MRNSSLSSFQASLQAQKKKSTGIERQLRQWTPLSEVNFGPKNKKVFRLQEPEDFVVTQIRHAFVPIAELLRQLEGIVKNYFWIP
jgi:hypothetical protein